MAKRPSIASIRFLRAGCYPCHDWVGNRTGTTQAGEGSLLWNVRNYRPSLYTDASAYLEYE